VEAIRVLRIARSSARHDRAEALNQLRSLVSTAPDDLRQQLRHLTGRQLIARTAALRPGVQLDVSSATKTALRELGRRAQYLEAQIARLDIRLRPLLATTAPRMVAKHGVGTDTAGALLVAAGDNPGRLRHEGTFAHLCGWSPIEASSGKLTRHRLNRGGDRQEPRPLAHRLDPHGLRPRHPRLRRATDQGRQVQARDHPVPQALRRPGALPAPTPGKICLP
jgi:transposase